MSQSQTNPREETQYTNNHTTARTKIVSEYNHEMSQSQTNPREETVHKQSHDSKNKNSK